MLRWTALDQIPPAWERSVITIGVFDGIHIGHQRIIGTATRHAAERGMPAVVVTFDPHPAEVLRPGSHPEQLTAQRHKTEILADLGVAAMLVIPFTVEFSLIKAERFVYDVLLGQLHAAEIVVGENFRFGHKAAGDIALLTEMGQRLGFRATAVRLVTDGDLTVSSTFVRSCVAAGDVEAAARALGRPHRVEGIVVRGDQRGRLLGYPTANVEPTPHAAVPADGIYAGYYLRDGQRLPASISVGPNPTFAGSDRRVEAYVLDVAFDEFDVYGEHAGVEFVARLRDTEAFTSVPELVAQIGKDVDATRNVVSAQ